MDWKRMHGVEGPVVKRTPTNREDLHLLVEKLDDIEVDVVLGYVANMLLDSAAVEKENSFYGKSKC